jgi:hypothetical protein
MSDQLLYLDPHEMHRFTDHDEDLMEVMPRVRVLSTFSLWWEEIERVVYSDTSRTTKCLHVISRILEDSAFASTTDIDELFQNVSLPAWMLDAKKDVKKETGIVNDRLVKIVIEDFADVAYSVFQRAKESSTDVPFLSAVTRFLVAFKNACIRANEDFYSTFPPEGLIELISSHLLTSSDEILTARIAYITGELIEDTNIDSPVSINDFINRSITKFQSAFTASKSYQSEIPQLINTLFSRTNYFFDIQTYVPTPHIFAGEGISNSEIQNNSDTSAEPQNLEWINDDCQPSQSSSLIFQLSLAVGHLRLLSSVADYTETLSPVIETDFVSFLLASFSFPLFDLQSVALSWFGSAMAHKRIAIEFIEKNGLPQLLEFMYPSATNNSSSDGEQLKRSSSSSSIAVVTGMFSPSIQPALKERKESNNGKKEERKVSGNSGLGYHDSKAQYVSYITVSLAKHAQVVDQLITSEEKAAELVSFGLRLLDEKSYETQLNIMEWFGDCFGHPFFMKAVNATNLLEVLVRKLEETFRFDEEESKRSSKSSSPESVILLNHSLRRESLRSLSKYLTINLHYEVTYSKKMEGNINLNETLRRSGGQGTGRPPQSFSSPVTRTLSNGIGENNRNRNDFFWLSSLNMIKLDENAITQLEFYVIQTMIDYGHLPVGMKMDLFQSSSLSSSDLSIHNPSVLAGLTEDDTISIASTVKKSSTDWIVAKQFLQSSVIPTILKTLLIETKDNSMYISSLSILELLCLDYTMILEIQHCQVSSSSSALSSLASPSSVLPLSAPGQTKKGIEIILSTISQDSRKDPSVIAAALRVLSAMATPPHYRYKGNSVNKARSLLLDVLNRSNTVANTSSFPLSSSTPHTQRKNLPVSSSKKLATTPSSIPSKEIVRLEQIQKAVRTAIRSFSGITSLIQLIHYKKNQFYILHIRLETVKVLIGVAHDNEIKVILSKMRIPMIIENQIKFENSELKLLGNDRNELVAVTKTAEKDLLTLYSEALIKLLTKSSIEGISDENVDASQDIIDRKSIVEHSHVRLYFLLLSSLFLLVLVVLPPQISFKESELMYLIKEHLLQKGLLQTVETLEKELGGDVVVPSIGEMSPSSALLNRSSSHLHHQPQQQLSQEPPISSQKVTAFTPGVPFVKTPSFSGKSIRSKKRGIDTLDNTDGDSDGKADHTSDNDRLAVSKRVRHSPSPFPMTHDENKDGNIPPSSASYKKDNTTDAETLSKILKINIPVPRSIRLKNIRKAMKSQGLFSSSVDSSQQIRGSESPSFITCSPSQVGGSSPLASIKAPQSIPSLPSTVASSVPVSAAKKIFAYYHPSSSSSSSTKTHNKSSHISSSASSSLSHNQPVSSKLSSIMNRYLKIQHQQCKHPITTLPTLSLMKPHYCSKPSTRYYSPNIFSIQNRKYSFSNTNWYNVYYRRNDNQEKLHYIYSNYRIIKTLRELETECSFSASCFSKKQNQLWLTFNDYTMEEDPGIALVDILTGQMSVGGHNELTGSISNIQLSPHSFHMLTALTDYTLPTESLDSLLQHEVILWKDTQDINIFDSPFIKKYQIYNTSENPSHLSVNQLDNINSFHSELFDPFHTNRLACVKMNDPLHQASTMNNGRSNIRTSLSHDTDLPGTNQTTSYIFDLETGQIVDHLYNDGNSDTYLFPKITYHSHSPSLYFMDGKLWDLRINQIIHKFDKLSNNGNMIVHPYKNELLIDSAVWDLRMFSLLTMIPLAENCKFIFHPIDNILFGYGSLYDDEKYLNKIIERSHYPFSSGSGTNSHYNSFHCFHSTEYNHLSSEYIEKENMNIINLSIDPFNDGYLNTLMFNMNDKDETMCRIYEIGKRKKLGDVDDEDGLNGEDDYDSEENDEDWMNVNDDDDEDASGDETLSSVDEYIDGDDISSGSDDSDDSDDDSDMDTDDDDDNNDDNGEDDAGSVASEENPVNVRRRHRRRQRDNEVGTERDGNIPEGEIAGEPIAEDEAGWETVSEESGGDDGDSEDDDSDFDSDDMEDQ